MCLHINAAGDRPGAQGGISTTCSPGGVKVLALGDPKEKQTSSLQHSEQMRGRHREWTHRDPNISFFLIQGGLQNVALVEAKWAF